MGEEEEEVREKEKEELLRGIRAFYAPASSYIPIDEMDLNKACYKLYLDDCSQQRKQQVELSDELLRYVRAVHEDEAIARYKAEYMRDSRRREETKVWMEDKIVEAERAGDRVVLYVLRLYLKAVGGEVAPRVRAEVEERAIAAGTRRRIHRRCCEEEEEEESDDSQDIIQAPQRQRVEGGGTGEQGVRKLRGVIELVVVVNWRG